MRNLATAGACTLAVVVMSGGGAAAAECGPLKQLASLPIERTAEGLPTVPVTIGTATKKFVLAPMDQLSGISPTTVEELKIETHQSGTWFSVSRSGEVSRRYASLPQFALGPAGFSGVRMLVLPEAPDDPDVAGELGADLLSAADVDVDFAANRMGLFSPDHCPGRVVYWQASAVAVLPFERTGLPMMYPQTQIAVPMTLDGEALFVVFETRQQDSSMPLREARRLFGLGEGAEGLEPIAPLPERPEVKRFRYRFKALSANGITINNLNVILYGEDPVMERAMPREVPIGSMIPVAPQRIRTYSLSLGRAVLNRLHIYIANKEEKVYVTPAAPAAAPMR